MCSRDRGPRWEAGGEAEAAPARNSSTNNGAHSWSNRRPPLSPARAEKKDIDIEDLDQEDQEKKREEL